MKKIITITVLSVAVSSAQSAGDLSREGLEGVFRSLGAKRDAGKKAQHSLAPPSSYGPYAGKTTPAIPLQQGLTIVTAINEGGSDYEFIKQITSVSGDSVNLSYSAERPEGGHADIQRVIRRQDLQAARKYEMTFDETGPSVYPGTTWLGISGAVFDELKNEGQSSFSFDANTVPQLAGILQTILKSADGEGRKENGSDFYFLDNPQNPIALSYRIGTGVGLQVVKISFPAELPVRRMEQQLAEGKHAEVYGIYFDTGSARIRTASEPVLKEIAEVMRKKPSWQLGIEGHTDKIGNGEDNLELSKRRSAAVKQALIDRYSIDASRLTTAGYGASRPKASNDSLEVRAQNRRVELVRQTS